MKQESDSKIINGAASGMDHNSYSNLAADIAFQKEQRLRVEMRLLKNALVAYSGGVDSSYLALIATQELGEKSVCVLGISPSVSKSQQARAIEVANENGYSLETIGTNEIENDKYVANSRNRCFYCKEELYTKLRAVARDREIPYILDGTNADDLKEHRPGMLAAEEFDVRSPLAELGFTKEEIRIRSFELKLKTWDEPASPCLASRIAYDIPVSIERLSKIEKAESFLRTKGLREFRVRSHGELARIEISKIELGEILHEDFFHEVNSKLRTIGFKFVTIDMAGFRSGSMN